MLPTSVMAIPTKSPCGARFLPSYDFEIRGHTKRCTALINLKDHLLIGISPFNSRFSPAYLKSLITWGYNNFSNVDVLLPDLQSAATLLLANGTPRAKALRKSRKELNRHRRYLTEFTENSENTFSSIRILEFNNYSQHETYKKT